MKWLFALMLLGACSSAVAPVKPVAVAQKKVFYQIPVGVLLFNCESRGLNAGFVTLKNCFNATHQIAIPEFINPTNYLEFEMPKASDVGERDIKDEI